MALDPLIIIEKNKISSNNPFFVILDITITNQLDFTDIKNLYLVNNNENIFIPSLTNPSLEQEYIGFPFSVGVLKQNNTGRIESFEIQVSNVDRRISDIIEDYQGGVNSDIKMTIISADNLDLNYSELEYNFTILSTKIDEQNVIFTCGLPSPLLHRFPLHRYIATSCRFEYKKVECSAVSEKTTCNKSLENCRERNNSPRFGGFRGLKNKTIILAR